MSKPRFDKTRDYGTIHPPFHGAGYLQDGVYFSNGGEFLFRESDEPDGAASKSAGASAPAAKVADKQPEKPADAGSGNPGADDSKKPAATPADPSQDVDLAAWAKGEAKFPFFAVKKAAAAKLPDVELTNAASIKAALADAGMI